MSRSSWMNNATPISSLLFSLVRVVLPAPLAGELLRRVVNRGNPDCLVRASEGLVARGAVRDGNGWTHGLHFSANQATSVAWGVQLPSSARPEMHPGQPQAQWPRGSPLRITAREPAGRR